MPNFATNRGLTAGTAGPIILSRIPGGSPEKPMNPPWTTRSRPPRTAALALLGLLGLLGGCGESPRNLLFVSCDALRADHVGTFGRGSTTPRIDRLSREGVLFRTAFAPRGQTWPSLTSVLTSKYPITHGVRTNGALLDAAHESFPEYLQRHGYTTAAFLANMARAAHRGYDELYTGVEKSHGQYEADRELASRAARFLQEHRKGPFFLWVHFMNPHGPYRPPDHADRFRTGPPGRFRASRKNLHRIALERIELDDADLASLIADYDGDVFAADECVGVVLDALADRGLEDDTLVVFFSDHGEELYQRHHYFMHSASVYDSVLHVPLVFRWPGTLPRGATVPGIVELIDIVPTASTLLGLPIPPWAEGSDLTPLLRGRPGARGRDFAMGEWAPPMEPTERTREVVGDLRGREAVEALEELDLTRDSLGKGDTRDDLGVAIDPTRSKIFTIRTERFRYVYNPGEETPNDGVFAWEPGSGFPIEREELYDHGVDPREDRNRIGELPGEAAKLRERVLAWETDKKRNEGRTVLTQDPETLQRLEELGYLAPRSGEGGGGDPGSGAKPPSRDEPPGERGGSGER
jgi:arylsulfatase A-like enzyme